MTSYKECIKALSDAFLQKGIHYNLDNVLSNCKKLGNPQEKLPPCIHIAGTNGKGSTVAYIKAGLESKGDRVHVFTSPHLINITERIQIAGKIISKKYFEFLLAECIKISRLRGTQHHKCDVCLE